MPHTSTTNPFADKQVVPMFILSPKVIQRFVRRQIRRPCCIHRMTNEGQTGEQKLKICPISAPLPPLRWGKTASAAAAARHASSGGPVSAGPAASWSDGQKHALIRRPGDDRFAVMNSDRAPGQAQGLTGPIRLADPASWSVTTSLNRFPNTAYTVDSDNEGQGHRNAKGLRIRRSYNPFEASANGSLFKDRPDAGW